MRALILAIGLAACAPVLPPDRPLTPTEARGLAMLHELRAADPCEPIGKHEANTLTAENAAVLLNFTNYNLGLRLGADESLALTAALYASPVVVLSRQGLGSPERSAYRGVQIESRWSVLAELDKMRRIIDAMPELMARRLESIWCDSNAGSCYAVTVRPGLWVPDLRRAIADAVLEAGGHNGIVVEADGGNGCHIDPDWGEPL